MGFVRLRQLQNSLQRLPLVIEITVLFLVYSNSIFATLDDVIKAEEQKRASFASRFSQFTQDKNVMGKVKTLDGKTLLMGSKTHFDSDDKISYRSDLTEHDYSFNNFNVDEYTDPNDPKKKLPRDLPEFISPHGKLKDSSELERKTYTLFDKFFKLEAKKTDQQRLAAQKQKGIRYENAFKITTQEVLPDKKVPVPPGRQPPPPRNVERIEWRDETKKEIDEIGTRSAQGMINTAKDPGSENDPKAQPSLTMLYEGAARALQSWYDRVTSKIGQRRAFDGVSIAGALPPTVDKVRLGEDTPRVQDWEKKAQAELAKEQAKGLYQNPQQLKNAKEEIARMAKEATQLLNLPSDTVNPKFDFKGAGQPSQLKSGDIKDEDRYSRDLRVQRETLAKAGIRLNKIPSEWKYNEKDEKADVVLSYDKETNAANKPTPMRVDEQMADFNDQLVESIDEYKKIQSKLPDKSNNIDPEKWKESLLKPETQTVMAIEQRAVKNGLEEIGAQMPKSEKSANTYNDLVNRN